MPDIAASPIPGATPLLARYPSCAVLVMSCDAYRDLWTPFFTLFWRHWPDCPFPIYLGTNRVEFNDSRITSLNAGDCEWSGRLRSHLDDISAQYILLLLEDYFFTEPIATDEVIQGLCSLDQLNGTVLRLYPLPGPDQTIEGYGTIGRIELQASYRVSTQAALWNKARLSELLLDEENIWDFEWNGSRRSQARPDGFYSTYKTLLPYRQVVERGEWFRSAAR